MLPDRRDCYSYWEEITSLALMPPSNQRTGVISISSHRSLKAGSLVCRQPCAKQIGRRADHVTKCICTSQMLLDNLVRGWVMMWATGMNTQTHTHTQELKSTVQVLLRSVGACSESTKPKIDVAVEWQQVSGSRIDNKDKVSPASCGTLTCWHHWGQTFSLEASDWSSVSDQSILCLIHTNEDFIFVSKHSIFARLRVSDQCVTHWQSPCHCFEKSKRWSTVISTSWSVSTHTRAHAHDIFKEQTLLRLCFSRDTVFTANGKDTSIMKQIVSLTSVIW